MPCDGISTHSEDAATLGLPCYNDFTISRPRTLRDRSSAFLFPELLEHGHHLIASRLQLARYSQHDRRLASEIFSCTTALSRQDFLVAIETMHRAASYRSADGCNVRLAHIEM
jgi:hypothetical protein